MADYVRTEQTIMRIRYELRAPTNAVEMGKAITAAAASFQGVHGRSACDDELIVAVEDEMIVVWFTVAPR